MSEDEKPKVDRRKFISAAALGTLSLGTLLTVGFKPLRSEAFVPVSVGSNGVGLPSLSADPVPLPPDGYLWWRSDLLMISYTYNSLVGRIAGSGVTETFQDTAGNNLSGRIVSNIVTSNATPTTIPVSAGTFPFTLNGSRVNAAIVTGSFAMTKTVTINTLGVQGVVNEETFGSWTNSEQVKNGSSYNKTLAEETWASWSSPESFAGGSTYNKTFSEETWASWTTPESFSHSP